MWLYDNYMKRNYRNGNYNILRVELIGHIGKTNNELYRLEFKIELE